MRAPPPQTINTKLAMADLGLMFGGAAATAHPDSPKPMFGVANPDSPKPMCFAPPRPPPSPSSSPVRTALSNSVSVKLTNADILRQTLVNNQVSATWTALAPLVHTMLVAPFPAHTMFVQEEEEEEEKEKEKEKEEEDDIYGDAEGPSFEVYCEDPPICEPVTPGFAIFTDEGGGDEAGEEPAAFSIFQDEGDVSCIHAADNTMLSNMSMAQTPAAAGSERGDGAVEYDDEWTRQIKQSVKKALQVSPKSWLRLASARSRAQRIPSRPIDGLTAAARSRPPVRSASFFVHTAFVARQTSKRAARPWLQRVLRRPIGWRSQSVLGRPFGAPLSLFTQCYF